MQQLCAVVAAAVVLLSLSGTEAKTQRLDGAQWNDNASNVSQFEVASIRPNKSGDGPFVIQGLAQAMGGRFSATNVTVQLLIQSVYQLPAIRVIGGPAWLASERFDIAAKARDNSSTTAIHGMVRRLLADRFGLRVHTEQRDGPVYILTKARRDGRLGPALRPSDADCVAAANGPSPAAPSVPNPTAPPPCGNGGGRPGLIRGRGLPLSYLASALTRTVGRVVIDQTGLAGYFDYELQWTLEQPSPASADTQNTGVGIPVFTSLREQLGLKLESGRSPVEVLVIDRAEKPALN